MKNLLCLYQAAERADISIYRFPLPETESLCIQDEGGRCHIAIDESRLCSEADHTVHLAHELGHCITGSFYNIHSPLDVRQKHENRADKWAIQACVSAEALDEAVADGCTDLWSLAERFGVTEAFMRKAVCLHVFGNLAVQVYL